MNFNDCPSVVIIGKVGSGKTTLLNKICNSNEKVKAGGFSITRNLFLKGSAHGSGFQIMDTPGLGSGQDQLGHIAAIYSALIQKPLNLILITLEFTRVDTMKSNLKNMLYMLERYKKQICVVITRWDESEDLEEDEIQIKKYVLQPCGIEQYILSGKETNGEQICGEIDKKLKETKKDKLEINETEFYSAYDLESNQFFSIELKQQTDQLRDNFQQICSISNQFIDQQNGNSPDTPEIMHSLIFAIRKRGKQMIKEFQNENQLTFDQLLQQYDSYEIAYFFAIHLKKMILEDMNKVIFLAQEKMKSYPKHIYNNIKQCQNCGLIWVKVAGCSNTKCGNFPIKDDKAIAPSKSSYYIKFENQKIIYQKNENLNIVQKQYNENLQNLQGCGAKMQWDKLPPLPEKILNELLAIGVLDYLNYSEDEGNKYTEEQMWKLIVQDKLEKAKIVKEDLSNLEKRNLEEKNIEQLKV